MIDIAVSDKIYAVCPDFKGAAVLCRVHNVGHSPELWTEIDDLTVDVVQTLQLSDIKNNVHIEATRKAYKALGKDPNRYRPSAEALLRRLLRGLPLYQIDNLVDLINLLSLETGYSIGGFDFDKISGSELVLGVGEDNEKFEAIGRGLLNIEGLPVYRDAKGGIGTPTSDEERTKLSLQTSTLLMLINGYSGEQGLAKAVERCVSLLHRYAKAEDVEVWYY